MAELAEIFVGGPGVALTIVCAWPKHLQMVSNSHRNLEMEICMAHTIDFAETQLSSAELGERAVRSGARANSAHRWAVVGLFAAAAVAVGGALTSSPSSTLPSLPVVLLGFAGMIGSGALGLYTIGKSRNAASRFERAAREAARRELISSPGPARRALYGAYLDRDKPGDHRPNLLRAWKPGEAAPF
jgi:hypothetical protein